MNLEAVSLSVCQTGISTYTRMGIFGVFLLSCLFTLTEHFPVLEPRKSSAGEVYAVQKLESKDSNTHK